MKRLDALEAENLSLRGLLHKQNLIVKGHRKPRRADQMRRPMARRLAAAKPDLEPNEHGRKCFYRNATA
jgi:hypothetical protein